ncbi:transmembrane protein FAM155A isoform X1 [Rousettus aegyptiacus]|uniref:Family with sequence similarity 155 member A n=1 Tax=Rousettus aegyptiacus TaxID=9407 RepID=A0A7J8DWA4_ROUAE|nr:transmembrane protein FAM155A isoform X1 [Rousettus aegyptiacus]KAF6427508.1 family with sequence similarity 155 member A [Rousettus aegyptiacus]
MTRGAWMCRQYDDGLKIWLAAPRENEKPFIDSERAQKWRLSLASLLFFTVLLSDHLWFCAEAKLTRTRDKEQHQHQQQQHQHQRQQQQRQRQQQQQQQQRQRQQEPSWPALLASMGESSPAAQAHRLLSASSSPTLPPSPGDGGGGKGNRGKNNRSKALFLGNSAKPVWRLETCYPQGASSGQCFTVESADAVCARNWSRGVAAGGEEQQVRGTHPTPLWNLSDFYLSFCNSYTLWELFSGLSSPNTLNCSLDVVLKEGGEMTTCRQCIEAYQDYDHHAQEKYEEFESVLHKYLQSEEYSVKSCPEDCKIVYKAWLCSQYFEVAQFNCRKTIPCKQYCLEVQTRCPFILPDNDEVIYGGLSSFICTGLSETFLTNDEPECCDVRRQEQSNNPSRGMVEKSGSCHRTSLTVSSATRLCNSRLKLCVLVLILLHTVLTASAAQNTTALDFGGINTLEESSTNEE